MKSLALRIGPAALCAALVGAAPGASVPAADPAEVAVVGGGIGDAELQALAARENEFNLKLVFSLVQGNYLADVDVVVRDAKGTRVIERRADGPIVLARLPAGEYSIAASRSGKAVTRKVKVGAGRLRTEYFRWPADPEQDLPVSRWLDRD